MQSRKIVPKRWNLDIKTSSPDTQSLRVQMPECVNYSRRWLCLGNKYFLTSTSTIAQYNKTADCLLGLQWQLHPFKNPHRLPTEHMGIHHSPHTHTIPIPMEIPMGIPIPTAALKDTPGRSTTMTAAVRCWSYRSRDGRALVYHNYTCVCES